MKNLQTIKTKNDEKLSMVILLKLNNNPSKIQEEKLIEIEGTKEVDAEFFYIDVSDEQEIAIEHGVRRFPTVLIFSNGELKATIDSIIKNNEVIKDLIA